LCIAFRRRENCIHRNIETDSHNARVRQESQYELPSKVAAIHACNIMNPKDVSDRRAASGWADAGREFVLHLG
jgi:hypothetical protein